VVDVAAIVNKVEIKYAQVGYAVELFEATFAPPVKVR
jgi:hypothetical protein